MTTDITCYVYADVDELGLGPILCIAPAVFFRDSVAVLIMT